MLLMRAENNITEAKIEIIRANKSNNEKRQNNRKRNKYMKPKIICHGGARRGTDEMLLSDGILIVKITKTRSVGATVPAMWASRLPRLSPAR